MKIVANNVHFLAKKGGGDGGSQAGAGDGGGAQQAAPQEPASTDSIAWDE